jgi:biotin carboxyl carrier protein
MEKKFRITVDGRPYIVTVEDISEDSSWIAPEPGSLHVPASVVPPPVAAPTASGYPAGPGDELSPLAGIVHSVDVTVGQTVREGDKVATLDAMKMITTVPAHQSGKVTEIVVKPGDVVEAGQRLLTIA